MTLTGQIARLTEIADTGPVRERLSALERLDKFRREKEARQRESQPIPRDPLDAALWILHAIESRIADAPGYAAGPLITQVGTAVDRIVQLERERRAADKPAPTAQELFAELLADLPGWSDEEILAVHAEGLRREIPGFVPRVDSREEAA